MQDIVEKYNCVIERFYKEIEACGSLENWEKRSDVSKKSRVDELDFIWPEEKHPHSKSKIYVCHDGTYSTDPTSYSNGRWGGGQAIANTVRPNFIFNDILLVKHATGVYSGGLVFYSSATPPNCHMIATRDITQQMLMRMTKGVLIGRFTFDKTGGYLSLKMLDQE